MNEAELKLRIGQRIGVGFEGLTVPEELKKVIRENKLGNVILFRRNVESFEQLKALCEELTVLIREETGFDPFIMIDEECGSVSRLAHITFPTPSAMAIGATGDPENAYRIARILGDELRTAGVNFDLAPVRESVSLLMEGRTDYEFRTTTTAELHDAESFRKIGEWIHGARRYFLQKFTDRETVPFEGFHAPTEEQIQAWAQIMRAHAGEVGIRG